MTPEWVAVVEALDEMAPDTVVGRNSMDGSPVTAREAAVHLRAGDPWADEYMADVVNVAVTLVSRAARDSVSERAAIVAALRRWAEEGCDPWMSYCADRIEEGAHMAPVGTDGVPENSCRRCVHFRPAASWTCPGDALAWAETWVYDATDTEPKPGAPRCPGMKEK